MVSAIKQFFQSHIQPPSDSQGRVSEHSVRIATAALLIEMMRADSKISEDEQETITSTIRSRFKLTIEETGELLKLAEEEIHKATGYFEFTSLINKGFTYDQKVMVIEHLWDVAFSDAILDKYEEYMVRKIADLIHVSHRDYIEAKLKIRKMRLSRLSR